MDYTVRDSSIAANPHARAVRDGGDYSIRVGMVRQMKETPSGDVKYIVDVASGGRQIPVSCTMMTKFGGVHNYEDYVLRPWAKSFPTAFLPGGSSVSQYNLRSGDVVLVAYLEGQAREGVILGGLAHPARSKQVSAGDIEYNSKFNGIEKIITKNGSYKTLFHGAAINDALLDIPPTGADVPEPIYNPLAEGSYYGFSSSGSFIASDGNQQFLKIGKDNFQTTIVSGTASLTLNALGGIVNIRGTQLAVDSQLYFIKAAVIGADTTVFSVKAVQVAIGNDQIELVDGLLQLIDAIGSLTITSPVGLCTPFQAAPQWAASVLPLKIKLTTLKGALQDPGSSPGFQDADSDSEIA